MGKASILIMLFYLLETSGKAVLGEYGVSAEWATFWVYGVMFVMSLILHGKRFMEDWQHFCHYSRGLGNFLLKLVAWSDRVGVVTAGLYFTFLTFFGVIILPAHLIGLGNAPANLPLGITWLLLLLLAPVVEEFVFRDSLVGVVNWTHKMKLVLATILSILAFTMLHVVHLAEVWFYLPLSIAVTALYINHERNVIASILFQSFYNVATYLVLLFLPSLGSI